MPEGMVAFYYMSWGIEEGRWINESEATFDKRSFLLIGGILSIESFGFLLALLYCHSQPNISLGDVIGYLPIGNVVTPKSHHFIVFVKI